jgi:CRISPR-associated endoribonuclease Cas6
MRLEITLRPLESNFRIPINYNYPLGSAFYKIFANGSKEFTDWLHQHGYITSDGKPMKLFCFSRLFISQPVFYRTLLGGHGNSHIIFSSPVEDDITDAFIRGVLKNPYIDIANKSVKSSFRITNVQKLPEPEFKHKQKYIMISPSVASTMRDGLHGPQVYYMRADDPDLSKNLEDNIRRKYSLIYDEECTIDFEIKLDNEYIRKRGGASRVSKLITIKEGKPDESKIRAFVVPFTLTGPPEIHKLIWDSGIGHKNSMGFGMVDFAK